MHASCLCACLGTVATETRQSDLSDVAAGAQKEGSRNMDETETERGGFSQWRYSHYFNFDARKGKTISVKCTQNAALACKRVRGRHTYDVIANEIEQIHSAYGLSHKVTACVTDNGSNFVKAFRMFKSKHPGAIVQVKIY